MLNVLRVVAVIACLPVCTHALAGESNWLKCLASINQRYMTVFGETILQVEPSKDILLVDPAYHTNAGDIFIIGGEERLIKLFPKINSRLQSCGVVQSTYGAPSGSYRSCNKISEFSNLGNVALYHGGGNWGDLYPIVHESRIHMIEILLKNGMTIISMPQSLHFQSHESAIQDGKHVESILTKTVGLANASQRLILTWREKESLDEAMVLYPYAQNRLVPDIAFALGPLMQIPLPPPPKVGPIENVDILLFLRGDMESVLSKHRNSKSIQSTLDSLTRTPGSVTFRIVDWRDVPDMVGNDIWRPFDLSKKDFISLDTDRVLKACLSMFSTGTVVVADRLHATILAYLAHKPVVFVDQKTKKISKTLHVAMNSSAHCTHNENLKHANSLPRALEMALAMLGEEKY